MGLFGKLINKLRVSSDKTLREVSDFLGIAPSTLSDIEQGRRKPFAPELIERFVQIVGGNRDELLSLAAKEKKMIEIPANKNDRLNALAFSLARADSVDFEDKDVSKTMEALMKALERKQK